MKKENIKQLKEYQRMLYVIDMVNGFTKFGALADPYIMHTVAEQIKLIEKFKKENQGVIFVKDCHEKNAIEFKTFPEHCIVGTSEADLIDELKEYEASSIVYQKNSTSNIFAPNAMKDLGKIKNLRQVVGVGCCTDICVLNFLIPLKNYFNQLNLDIDVFAVKSAIETYHIPDVHDRDYYNKIAYDLMKQAGIIVVQDFEELEQKELILERRGK